MSSFIFHCMQINHVDIPGSRKLRQGLNPWKCRFFNKNTCILGMNGSTMQMYRWQESVKITTLLLCLALLVALSSLSKKTETMLLGRTCPRDFIWVAVLSSPDLAPLCLGRQVFFKMSRANIKIRDFFQRLDRHCLNNCQHVLGRKCIQSGILANKNTFLQSRISKSDPIKNIVRFLRNEK